MESINQARVGSYLGVPIILENDKLFGTLCAVDPNPYEFSQSEINTMKRLANVLSLIISRQKPANIPEIDEKILQLEKLALVGQLSAGLAHEIRNPMQSVRGFVQFLFNDNEKLSFYKDIVIEELDRINELVNDFLLVTQPTAPKKETTSITKLVKETVEFLKNEASLYNIEIQLEIDKDIPNICFDPSQMKQVLFNLIKNAMEAIDEKGKIKVCVRKAEEHIIINIKDNGPGIPLSIINKIGDPFFTTKETGTGLGLSICKTIIQEHYGALHIENHEDGTLVSIRLPINYKA